MIGDINSIINAWERNNSPVFGLDKWNKNLNEMLTGINKTNNITPIDFTLQQQNNQPANVTTTYSQLPQANLQEYINQYIQSIEELLKWKPPKESAISEEEQKGVLYGALIGAGLASARGNNIIDALAKGAGAFSKGFVSGLDALYEEKKRQVEEEKLKQQMELQQKTFNLNVIGKQTEMAKMIDEYLKMQQSDAIASQALKRFGIDATGMPVGTATDLYSKLIANEIKNKLEIQKEKERIPLEVELAKEKAKALMPLEKEIAGYKAGLQRSYENVDPVTRMEANKVLSAYIKLNNAVSGFTPMKSGNTISYVNPTTMEKLTPEQYNQLLAEKEMYKEWYETLTGKKIPKNKSNKLIEQMHNQSKPSMPELPPADKYKNKIIRDTLTNERYVSDGKTWRKIE